MRYLLALFLVLTLAGGARAAESPLDGGWQLWRDPSGRATVSTLPAAGWRPVRVGLSWNAQFADMRDACGTVWYRTTFRLERVPPDTRVRFDAVDYFATVYVNGHFVGQHEGSYTPFTVDATGFVHRGANVVAVRVFAPCPGAAGPMRYDEIPHGKQDWYVPNGGIWQGVHLATLPAETVDDVHATPDLATGKVRLEVFFGGRGSLPATVAVRDPQGALVATASVTPVAGGPAVAEVRVPSPQGWSPDHPALYRIHATVPGQTWDDTFGFRTFEARGGQLYLNGRPFYMRAALDQDFYPDTIYTAPSKAYLVDEMRKARALGLNVLRCHIKVPQPEYLQAADETGMLVWTEIPCWNDRYHWTPQAAARGLRTFDEELARDWNHPCVVLQSIINESWGADLKDPLQRHWLLQAFAEVKHKVAGTGRLVVDNSPCCENFHIQSDLEDFHQYFSIPDRADRWDAWVAEFATHPAFTFSPFGDARRSGQEPLVVSEFGNWGLPQLARPFWWMDRQWGHRLMTRAGGVQARFAALGLGTMFADYNAWARATQAHQFLALKHEIEAMRRQSAIRGYVVTELTDVMWEANGLMDMDRRPKAYAAALAGIQQDDVVMAVLPRHNFTAGETVDIPLWVSHYSPATGQGSSILCRCGDRSQTVTVTGVPTAGAGQVGTWTVTLPPVDAPARVPLQLRWTDAAGTTLAGNVYTVNVFPSVHRPAALEAIYVLGDDTLGERIARSGAMVLSGLPSRDAAALLVAHRLDADVRQHLHDGGRVLLLADSEDALAGTRLQAVDRRHKDYWGDWIANFNWVRSDRLPFSALGFGPLCGWESEAVTPRYVLEGVPARAWAADVLSAESFGWVNPTVALVAQSRVGKGRLLVTTCRFDRYGSDPYATALLNALLGYAGSPAFQPSAWLR